jgi:hypothetical protein
LVLFLVRPWRVDLRSGGVSVLAPGALTHRIVQVDHSRRTTVTVIFTFALVGVTTFALAGWAVSEPEAFWSAGAAVLGYAVVFASMHGLHVLETRRAESTNCPYCLQTISVKAMVCHHCTRDLTSTRSIAASAALCGDQPANASRKRMPFEQRQPSNGLCRESWEPAWRSASRRCRPGTFASRASR